jgi:hypothetical protein
VNKGLNPLVQLLNEKLGLFLSISFGIFLFILFFHPFPLKKFDINDSLIFISGFGGIVFLLMLIQGIIVTYIFRPVTQNLDGYDLPAIMFGFILLSLCSVAFAFYLRYVGGVSITFYIMAKIILICIVPPAFLRWHETKTNLRHQVESLIIEKKLIQNRIEKYEDDLLNKYVEFNSESNAETLSLTVSEIAFIKSADNYVEIVYKDIDTFKKRLIRSTLKNIESQLRAYSIFVRCHRVCIVNMHYIEKLNKSFNNHSIAIKGYPEPIPVSRQYLLKLKEAL